ncbi:hypothetical protein EMIT053CA3_60262 [Pseudomonas donghuensis]
MKKTLAGVIEAGEPLIQQAIDAQRRYQAAQDVGQPSEEVERLRQEAESLYQAVTEVAGWPHSFPQLGSSHVLAKCCSGSLICSRILTQMVL